MKVHGGGSVGPGHRDLDPSTSRSSTVVAGRSGAPSSPLILVRVSGPARRLDRQSPRAFSGSPVICPDDDGRPTLSPARIALRDRRLWAATSRPRPTPDRVRPRPAPSTRRRARAATPARAAPTSAPPPSPRCRSGGRPLGPGRPPPSDPPRPRAAHRRLTTRAVRAGDVVLPARSSSGPARHWRWDFLRRRHHRRRGRDRDLCRRRTAFWGFRATRFDGEPAAGRFLLQGTPYVYTVIRQTRWGVGEAVSQKLGRAPANDPRHADPPTGPERPSPGALGPLPPPRASRSSGVDGGRRRPTRVSGQVVNTAEVPRRDGRSAIAVRAASGARA